MSKQRSYHGIFEPQNPTKYDGTRPIVWRSLWERKFMKYCDQTPGILRWNSESVIIPYTKPTDGQIHRYFVDFRIQVLTKNGTVKTMLIEIKPKKQTQPPPDPPRRTRRYVEEISTFAVNQAKWAAATKYCKERGFTFLVLTEDHLFDRVR